MAFLLRRSEASSHKSSESPVDVYAQRSRDQPPIKSTSSFQSNCLICIQKMRKDIHKTGEPKARYPLRN
ncbi:MAG: hypothetical protein E5299_01872 [Burkholderia gladioli]|nr:MAG: hypothetical protein E5299_01872 [Burkholderia gladioli]